VGFAPGCVSGPKPKVFLIDTFINAGDDPTRKLSAYPAETRQAFDREFMANLALLPLRKATDGPKKQVPPLFEVTTIPNLDGVPKLLGAGDVVLGFAYFPPYDAEQMAEDTPVPTPQLAAEMQKLVRALWQAMTEAWAKVAIDPKGHPGLPKPEGPPAGDSGLSTFFFPLIDNVKLKTGKQQKLYWSLRLGLVDVGWPASDALRVETLERKRVVLQQVLGQPDDEAQGFGPKAVAAVAEASDGLRERYLEVVGKGLAYTALHEFWHVAAGGAKHPARGGSEIIESSPRPTGPNLRFQQASIDAIVKHYESTWCKAITDGRRKIGETSP
jgi:hypothetical protein